MNLSKWAIVLVGKVSYVGSNIWRETCLLPLLNSIPSDQNVDIICLVWDHDVPGGSHEFTQSSGYGPTPLNKNMKEIICRWDNNRYYGNIPMKPELSDYLTVEYGKHPQINQVRVLLIDYYSMLNRLHEYFNIGKEQPDNLYYQVQHFQLTEAYKLYPEVFQNYSMITRVRYDSRWEYWMKLELFSIVLNKWREEERLVSCVDWPTVLISTHIDKHNQISLGGTISVNDTAFVFDQLGFETFCKNYESWVCADVYSRCTYYTKNDELLQINYGFKYSAERHFGKFLLDNNYNIISDNITRGPIQKSELWHNSPSEDDHRIRWYQYNLKEIYNDNNT